MLTLIVPFLIKLIVPTSITADRPVFAFWRRGPNFGLTIPCFERSPNTKFDNLTRRPSTTFAGMCWTKVMPNRIISFVTTCTCKHTTCHTHIYFCKSTAAYIDKYRAFMFLELSPFKKKLNRSVPKKMILELSLYIFSCIYHLPTENLWEIWALFMSALLPRTNKNTIN